MKATENAIEQLI